MSKWEDPENSNLPNPVQVERIAQHFGVPIGHIYSGGKDADTGNKPGPGGQFPTAPGDREKLIQWLEWLTEILRHDLLPGLVWEGGGEGGGPGGQGGPSVDEPPPVGGGAERLSLDREEQADEGA